MGISLLTVSLIIRGISPIMNTFNKELTLLIRNRIFMIILPVYALFLGIIHFLFMDIYIMYSLIPIALLFLIPLLTYGLWYREVALGLEGFILTSTVGINRVIFEKIKFAFLVSLIFLLLPLPIAIVHTALGSVDLGRILTTNLGLILYIMFAVSLGLFTSTLLKGRILIYIVSVICLFLLTVNSSYGLLTKLNQDFFKGLFSVKSVFVLISLSFIIFNVSCFKIARGFRLKATLLALAICILGFYIPAKFDMTLKRSFTLTRDSKEVISNGEVPVLITYYYSEELTSRSSIVSDLKQVLKSFDSQKNCNVKFVKDSNPGFEKATKSFDPHPLGEGEELYSFVVIEYLTNYKVIPLVTVLETLEFDLLTNIGDLYRGSQKHIGIMPGNEVFTEDSFSALYSLLDRYFNVTFLFPGDRIPSDLVSLIVVGHYNIDYDALAEIGDFLSEGGNILVAGTGLPTDEALVYRSTPILDALKNTGITIEPFLIGDNNNVGLTDDTGRITPYPLNVITQANSSAKSNPIVSPFPGFNALYLSPVLTEDPRFETLLTSSESSWLVTKDTGIDGFPEGAYPASIYGESNIGSNFSGFESQNSSRFMVVGNSLSFTNFSYNLGIDAGYEFILKSILRLNGDDYLIESRNKFLTDKPLYKLRYPNKSKFFTLNIIVSLLYPLLVLLVCFIIRRKFS